MAQQETLLTWGSGSARGSEAALLSCCLGRCAVRRSSLPARAARGFRYAVLASMVCTGTEHQVFA